MEKFSLNISAHKMLKNATFLISCFFFVAACVPPQQTQNRLSSSSSTDEVSPQNKQQMKTYSEYFTTNGDIRDSISNSFTIDYDADNQAIQKQIKWYTQRPKYLIKMANQAAPYLYYIKEQVQNRY